MQRWYRKDLVHPWAQLYTLHSAKVSFPIFWGAMMCYEVSHPAEAGKDGSSSGYTGPHKHAIIYSHKMLQVGKALWDILSKGVASATRWDAPTQSIIGIAPKVGRTSHLRGAPASPGRGHMSSAHYCPQPLCARAGLMPRATVTCISAWLYEIMAHRMRRSPLLILPHAGTSWTRSNFLTSSSFSSYVRWKPLNTNETACNVSWIGWATHQALTSKEAFDDLSSISGRASGSIASGDHQIAILLLQMATTLMTQVWQN